MSKNIKYSTCYLLFFLCFASNAFGYGSLKGKVMDGFGTLLEGVAVKVKKTDTITTTDDKGEYVVKYTPGITEISFSKEGYTRNIITINVTEESDTEHKPVILWKYPKSGGLHLLNKDNYALINTSSFRVEEINNSLKFILEGEPTVVPWTKITLLDYDKENSLVSGKILFSVYDDNLLGFIGPSNYQIQTIKDRYIKIVNNAGIRVVTLEPGRYFYYSGSISTRTRMGKGYFIEIKP